MAVDRWRVLSMTKRRDFLKLIGLGAAVVSFPLAGLAKPHPKEPLLEDYEEYLYLHLNHQRFLERYLD